MLAVLAGRGTPVPLRNVRRVWCPSRGTKVSAEGLRMKAYEDEELRTYVDPDLPFMIRLDGHRFSKFTAPFQKPFDTRGASLVVISFL